MHRVIGPDRGQRHRQPVGPTRLDEETGSADQLGQGSDRRGYDRRAAREGLDDRKAGPFGEDREQRPARCAHKFHDIGDRQRRGVDERSADALARRGAGDRCAVVRTRTDEQDPWRPRHPVLESGWAACRRKGRECLEHRREVQSSVEPAAEHQVSTTQAESVAQRHHAGRHRGRGGRRRPEPDTRRHSDDTQAITADPQQSPHRPGRRLAADDDRGCLAQELPAQALAEPARDRALKRLRELPGSQVEQCDHDGQSGRDRQRSAPHGVVDGACGAGALRTPGRSETRAAQYERIHGQRSRPQQAGRRQLAPTDHGEVAEAHRRVVDIGCDEEGEGFTGKRVRIVGAEQPVEVGRRQRRSFGRLERTHVEDDSDPG